MAQSDKAVRVRFAPSPTGHLHVGGLRSAYFNWLFARHFNGTFLIRIEDTDTERSKKEYLESQLASLAWCGIHSDEPLVIQSERRELYHKIAHDMIAEGLAYRCYCTPADLEARLGQNAAEGAGYTKYDQKCRYRVDHPQAPYAVRFALRNDQSDIVVNDIIRGEVVFTPDIFDDFIILRSDGNPMYNFSVVIDDAAMHISHIIRGEEHLVNTPKQILLYKALHYEMPQFAHVPLILGADGTKLSKRDAAVSVIEYKKMGYLPEALCNYLIRLGWAHGDQEIFTQEELIALFTLDNVGKKGSIFDLTKLTWMNGVFLRKHTSHDIMERITRDCDPLWRNRLVLWSNEQIEALIALYKERIQTLGELISNLNALYHEPTIYELGTQFEARAIQEPFTTLVNELESATEWNRGSIEMLIKTLCVRYGLKLPQLAIPIRLALTGVTSSPSIYDLLVIMGKAESIKRLMRFVHEVLTNV